MVLLRFPQLWVGCLRYTLQARPHLCARLPNMFSTVHSRPHSIRKRMIAHIYSKSCLQNSPEMDKISRTLICKRYLPSLDASAASNQPVDILELTYAIAMDFITAYLFGLNKGSDFMTNVSYRKHFLSIYHTRKDVGSWYAEFPRSTSFLLRLGFGSVQQRVIAAQEEIEAWCLNLCQGAAKDLNLETKSPSTSRPTTPPIVYSYLHAGLLKTAPNSDPDLHAASEMLDHIIAGHETLGITFTYLTYELSKRPTLQAALRAELLTLSPPITYPPPTPSSGNEQDEPPALPSPKALDALPLLHALVYETLRLYAAAPGPQARVTPYPSCTLAGYANIPPGVRVSSNAHSLHRNKQVFPEPEKWKPERWLPAEKDDQERDVEQGRRSRLDEMMRWFWAFGSGARMCIGSHFAVQGEGLLLSTRVLDSLLHSLYRCFF